MTFTPAGIASPRIPLLVLGSWEQAKIMQMLVAVKELTSIVHALKNRRSLSRTCFHSKVAEEQLITPDWMTRSA